MGRHDPRVQRPHGSLVLSGFTGLVCAACGGVPSRDDPYPFRCPNARPGDDVDHVLRRVLAPELRGQPALWREIFLDPEPNPFVRYRQLLHSYQTALAGGLSDAAFTDTVRELDDAVTAVDGRGFRETPFARGDVLSRELGLIEQGGVWIKDESGNVSGSHKGRHLFGVMLWLRVMERLGRISPADAPPLAIASCGNAALAAALVARAAGRELHVFVPPDAHPGILERLRDLGARLVPCPRDGAIPGDPCFLRFRAAVAAGAIPFTCQGSENGLVIEGGMTLGWEMVTVWLRGEPAPGRMFVQVGGGALASACAQAFSEAERLGLAPPRPRFHAVQTRGGHPLVRAFERFVNLALTGRPGDRGEDALPASTAARAEAMYARTNPAGMKELLHYAAHHRAEFMWPWEFAPRSIATGILDDETYDWFAVLRGMLTSEGWPVVASEEEIAAAHRLAREGGGVRTCVTGAAGLAGLMHLRTEGAVEDGERIAVLFTGSER